MRASRPLVFALAAAGCGGTERPLSIETTSRPLAAYCQAKVTGKGTLDVESDYIPHVVACENGDAPAEALKAQAVAARTYLYYKLETSGAIADGQGDQVYTCARAPGPQHVAAAAATIGEVLTYHGDVIASFFVAGAIPSAMDCVATASDPDATNTEHFVTYNRGLSGNDVHQTTLGYVNPTNYRNRGCQSQNGASCLAKHATLYGDILDFYYGMDIGHDTATGPCVPMAAGMPCAVIAMTDTMVPADGMCFQKSCKTMDRFNAVPSLEGGQQFTAPIEQAASADCTGRWNLTFAEAGDYAISAYTKSASPKTKVTYVVHHAGADDPVIVDQSAMEDWAPLGTYRFEAGASQWVELGDEVASPVAMGTLAIFDALRIASADARSDPGSMGGGRAHAGDPSSESGGLVSAKIEGSGGGRGCACVASPKRTFGSELGMLLSLLLAYRGPLRSRLKRVACGVRRLS